MLISNEGKKNKTDNKNQINQLQNSYLQVTTL